MAHLKKIQELLHRLAKYTGTPIIQKIHNKIAGRGSFKSYYISLFLEQNSRIPHYFYKSLLCDTILIHSPKPPTIKTPLQNTQVNVTTQPLPSFNPCIFLITVHANIISLLIRIPFLDIT